MSTKNEIWQGAQPQGEVLQSHTLGPQTTRKRSEGMESDPLRYRRPRFPIFWKNSTTSSIPSTSMDHGSVPSTSTGVDMVDGARVTAGFFRTLGVGPLLGRDFHGGEDLPCSATSCPKNLNEAPKVRRDGSQGQVRSEASTRPLDHLQKQGSPERAKDTRSSTISVGPSGLKLYST